MSKHSTARKAKGAKARPAWLLPLIAIVVVAVVIGAVLMLKNTNQPAVAIDVSGKPNLVVDKTVIDFGDVRYENPVTAVFTVSNTGDQPLQLLQQPRLEVLKGCCPPSAVASSTTINPGQTGTITVRFTMHEGMGGKHEFLVHLLTNDPAQSETQLHILSNWIA